MFNTKLSLSLLILILFLSPVLQADDWYQKGIMAYNDYYYKVPYVEGSNNFQSMKGLGFVMAYYCPKELLGLYAKAWGLNEYYFGDWSDYPNDPTGIWYEDLNEKAFADYIIAIMEVREQAWQGYNLMTPYEKRLINGFCEGINEAFSTLKTAEPNWYNDHLARFEFHFGNDDNLCIAPKHILALNLYDFAFPAVAKQVFDEDHFPEFHVDGKDLVTFEWQSQQWAFVDSAGVPWIQTDTHLPYLANQYSPFLCQVTTIPNDDEVGINYFGWNLLGLPFAGVCVRYAAEGLPPMAWGFCAHHGDLVDVYETDLIEDGGVKKYKWTDDDWVALTPREKITIEYPRIDPEVPQEYEITEVYETIHHGPVVMCRETLGKVYAFRGCWDLEGRDYQQSLNIVRELFGMLTAGSIEDALEVMEETRCLPTGSMIFANGDPAAGTNNDLPYKLLYILKGPLADRRETTHFQERKYDPDAWILGFSDGFVDPETGKDDVFDDLYTYPEPGIWHGENDVPFDYFRDNNGNPVEYFVNCNCSIEYNNPVSGLPGGPLDINYWLDNHGASLVWGSYYKRRQERVDDILDEYTNHLGQLQLPIDDTLIDILLLDSCHNLGKTLVTDLSEIYGLYLSQVEPQHQATITTAMNALLHWRDGSDPNSVLDDASSSKTSTNMFLYKLWQANFMAVTCAYDSDIWEEIFEVVPYRKSILVKSGDFAEPDQFCINTLEALYEAYIEWQSYPDGWIYPEGLPPEPHGENERQWKKHFVFFRNIGEPLPLKFETEGDNQVLMTNNPTYDIDWIDHIRTGAGGLGLIEAGDGQSAPMLIKLDHAYGIKIFYSKAAAPCKDPSRKFADDLVAGGEEKVFDVSCTATSNWVNHLYEEIDINPDPGP